MSFFLMILFFILILMFLFSQNLLLLLLFLEIFSFIFLFVFSINSSHYFFSDFMILMLFSIFVMEGVLGLSGLILLVSFSGSDYLKVSSLLKW